jgi:hypothetical protein
MNDADATNKLYEEQLHPIYIQHMQKLRDLDALEQMKKQHELAVRKEKVIVHKSDQNSTATEGLSGECALFALNHECLFLIHAV